jgi:hypothetical protein
MTVGLNHCRVTWALEATNEQKVKTHLAQVLNHKIENGELRRPGPSQLLESGVTWTRAQPMNRKCIAHGLGLSQLIEFG